MCSVTPHDEQALARVEPLATLVERLGISVPAIMLLESCKPLYRLVDHACALLPQQMPVLEHPFAALMRDRALAEVLIARLEHGPYVQVASQRVAQ